MRSAVVVGTGLIGASVALALTGRGVDTYLVDRDPQAALTAAAAGAGTAGRPGAPVDLAVIAVPPRHTAAVLREAQQASLARYFTDVASVKAGPQQEAAERGVDLARYVGGHPMAGSERSGPLAARADLFHGRPWILTPSAHSHDDAVSCALALVEACGARAQFMEHTEHDRAVALTSHAPHLVSSLLAARLLHSDEAQLRVAGQGLRDTTRIAGGDSRLWTDILGSNAAAVADILGDLALDLHVVLDALRDLGLDDPQARHRGTAELGAALLRGAQGQARIPARAADPNRADPNRADPNRADPNRAAETRQLSGAAAAQL
ncbi:prephenate dehydrogenase/arogenate dehydrogenase family protein [Streptacidiphilus sp. PB12-B1b]|nr:prephenate dehydrogenase/arogenate dehydrogenase family protein [Streptacidiphilus sp. PB12-B1b]